MGLDVGLVQGGGVNNRIRLEIANRPAHRFSVSDCADDLRIRRWHRVQADDLVPIFSQPRYQGLPNQPEEPVTRMRIASYSFVEIDPRPSATAPPSDRLRITGRMGMPEHPSQTTSR